ncbi:hypothetical protein PROFUN_15573, partial [Planoprotostelium fungivorum]
TAVMMNLKDMKAVGRGATSDDTLQYGRHSVGDRWAGADVFQKLSMMALDVKANLLECKREPLDDELYIKSEI